jgi:hypothetical protein
MVLKPSMQDSIRFVRLIPKVSMQVHMGANEAMTSTRIRRYDLERIMRLKLPREANWEFIMRLLNAYEAGKVED